MDREIKILIVDDRPENLLALQAILESSSYRLIAVTSGEEALKAVLKHDFAVILLDVQMPGLNGYETARLIRSREKSRYTPIIFITANYQSREHEHEGYALGAIDYIFKPIDPETLKGKIRGFAMMYRHREQLEVMVEQRTRELILANEALCKEIKHRKLIEARLQQEIVERRVSEAHFKAVFNLSRIGIMTQTADGRIIKANPVIQAMIGYSENELMGMSWQDFTHPDDVEKGMVLFQELIAGKTDHYEREKRYIRRDGQQVWVHIHIFVEREYSQELIVCFVQDITEKKLLQERMLRLDRLNIVGELAAGISHEVRNPITTVRGFLQVLGQKDDCAKYREYFQLMIEELDRANAMITEFLSIGRSQSSSFERQNLNYIIQALVPLIQADAIAQEKILYVQTSEVPDLLLNSKEIRQVILNLCRNGLEAMSPGGVLTIRTYLEDNQVVLAVEDQGEGIKPEILDKLGKPFVTTKEHGTGLGLGICYNIAARHHAKIDVDTGPGGTTFYVRFKADAL